MPFCRQCGVRLRGRFCDQCGTAADLPAGGAPVTEPPTEPPEEERTRAAMAYFVLPAVFYLLDDRFRLNRFLRFHSFQALLLLAAAAVGQLLIWGVLSFVLGLLTLVVGWLFTLFSFVLWAKTAIGAYSGRMAKIPVLGEFAEKQAL